MSQTLTAPVLAYCDYIADVLRSAMLDRIENGYADILASAEPVKSDLHPEGGWMVSTGKTIRVTDRNGRVYLVTVEEEPTAPTHCPICGQADNGKQHCSKGGCPIGGDL